MENTRNMINGGVQRLQSALIASFSVILKIHFSTFLGKWCKLYKKVSLHSFVTYTNAEIGSDNFSRGVGWIKQSGTRAFS